MKTPLAILLCFAFTGCLSFRTGVSNWWTAHKTQVGQTGALAAKDLAAFAVQALLAAAQSPHDAENKADLTDALAYGVRTMDKSSMVTADKVKAYLAIWTPNADHWNTIASETAAALAGGPSKDRQEAVARALNDAAQQIRFANAP